MLPLTSDPLAPLGLDGEEEEEEEVKGGYLGAENYPGEAAYLPDNPRAGPSFCLPNRSGWEVAGNGVFLGTTNPSTALKTKQRAS